MDAVDFELQIRYQFRFSEKSQFALFPRGAIISAAYAIVQCLPRWCYW